MENQKCEKCGMPLEDGAEKCANCGAPVQHNHTSNEAEKNNAPFTANANVNNAGNMNNVPPINQIPYGTPMHTEQQNNQPEVVSVGTFLLMILVSFIPIVNIIMYCIWAFSKSTPPNKKNFARAACVYVAIGIVLNIILIIFGFALVASTNSSRGSYYDDYYYYQTDESMATSEALEDYNIYY